MVVLSMAVKNSLQGNRPVLKALESSLQVPWRLLVVVDDGDDGTGRELARLAREHGRDAVVLRSARPTRAAARQTAIDYFLRETPDEWLMFLDDDVVLNEGWWDEARRYMDDPRVGLIWGIDYTPEWADRRAWLSARGLTLRQYLVQQFERRGGTHDTLLRRAAVEGIRIPEWLHVYEDAYIKRYVECRGFRSAVVEVGAVHHRRGGEGYEGLWRLMAEADAYLCISHVRLKDVAKALVGLPAYVYWAWRAWHRPLRGFQVWWNRLTYRWVVWRRQRCGSPCTVVREP